MSNPAAFPEAPPIRKAFRHFARMLMCVGTWMCLIASAQAQTASVVEWTFLSGTVYSANASTKNAQVTQATVPMSTLGVTMASSGTNPNFQLNSTQWSTAVGGTVGTSGVPAAGYWTAAANSATAVAPVTSDKVLYFNVTPLATAAIDLSALKLSFDATRSVSASSPTAARAYIVWTDAGASKRRYTTTAVALSGTTLANKVLDLGGAGSSGDTFPVNPGGYAFHIEVELTGATVAGSGVLLDNVKLLANAMQAGGCAIGNLVYNDVDLNGFYNTAGGDTAVSGAVVELLNSAGTVLKSTTTTATGQYFFTNLLPSGATAPATPNYKVRVKASSFASGQPLFGKYSSLPASPVDGTTGDDNVTGNDAGVDNNAPATNGITSHAIVLTAGTEPTLEAGALNTLDDAYDSNGDLTVDFGFRTNPIIISPGTIGATTGFVASPSTMAPFNPPAFSASGGTAPYTLSATGMPAWMSFNPATGVISGYPTAAGAFSFTINAVDSLGYSNSVTYNVTATANVVSGYVWNDADYDGVFEAGESAISGVTVALWNSIDGNVDATDTISTTVPFSAVTGANGYYTLTAPSPAGTYYVKIATPPAATPWVTNPTVKGFPTVMGIGGTYMVYSARLTAASPSAFTRDFGFAAAPASAAVGNLFNNPSFEVGTFTSDGVGMAGSPSAVPSRIQAYPAGGPTTWVPNYWLEGSLSVASPVNRWIDASSSGGGVDGTKIYYNKPSITASSYCIVYDDVRPLQMSTEYMVSAWVAAFTEGTAGPYSTNARIEFNHPATGINPATPVTFNSYSAGGTPGSLLTFNSYVTWPISSPSPKDMTGAPYTATAGQVLNWKSLNWQKVWVKFTPKAPILQILLSQTPGAGNSAGAVWDTTSLTTSATGVQCDFGDAITFAPAANSISSALKMGTNATDGETTNPISGTADADDSIASGGTDDEDLDVTTKTFLAGSPLTYVFPVTAGAAAKLMVWADWDNDGAVTGTNEIVTATALSVTAGTNNYSVTFNPPAGTSGTRYLRFRVQDGATAPTFSGFSAAFGEVEDYAVTVTAPTVGVGNLVWIDTNDNGRFDAGEGAANILVQAKKVSDNTVAGSATTDASGLYQITGLAAGSYYLFIPASEFATGKSLNGKFSMIGNGTDNAKDDDFDENGIDDVAPATNGIRSANITLTTGAEPTTAETGTDSAWDNGSGGRPADSNMDLTVDFGFQVCATSSTNLWINGNMEIPDPAVTYTTVFPSGGSAISYAWNGSTGVVPAKDWYWMDAGNYINDSTHAAEGSKFYYMANSDACILQTFGVGTSIVGKSNLTAGQVYDVSFDWAPFDPATPTGSATTSDILFDVDYKTTDGSATTSILNIFSFYDPRTNARAAVPRARSSWAALDWRRCRAQFIVPPAISGQPMLTAYLSTSTGKLLVDNVVITPACAITTTSVGSVIFNDVNGNGIMDSGDLGIDNVWVELYDSTTYVSVGQAFTRNGGKYLISGVQPGNYYLQLAPENFKPTSAWWNGNANGPLMNMLSSAGAGDPDAAANAATDDNVAGGDKGIDDADPFNNGVRSATFTVAIGNEPTTGAGANDKENGYASDLDAAADSSGNMTIDMGFTSGAATLSIGNLVWSDLNGNGIQDGGEPGINGVTVQLLKDADGNGSLSAAEQTPVATTTTSTVSTVVGTYTFSNLTTGKYAVRIAGSNFAPAAALGTLRLSSVTTGTLDNQVATDDNGIQQASSQQTTSPIITLAVGSEPNGSGNADYTIDFGFIAPNTVCKVLYICGTAKPQDGDAFDHGMMKYIESIHGPGSVYPVLAKTTGTTLGLYGLYTATEMTVTLTNYDLIVVAPTCYSATMASLDAALRDVAKPVFVMTAPAAVGMKVFSAATLHWSEYGWDGSANVQITNWLLSNPTPTFSPIFETGTYYPEGTGYLWVDAANQTARTGNFFVTYAPGALSARGAAATHGQRVFFGLHMNSAQQNAANTGLTVLEQDWFDPLIDLTSTGKAYLDQALTAALAACINDFGDLADTTAGTGAGDYQSLLANNGPRHVVTPALRMGATNTAEVNALQNAAANGDSSDDGVPSLPALIAGGMSPTFNVSVANTGAAAKLSIWIDFNNDGSFNDTVINAAGDNGGEKVALDLAVATSATSILVPSFKVPANAYTAGAIGVRLRLSTAAALTSLGAAPDGEVEDYKLTIAGGVAVGNLVWIDANDNGRFDAGEGAANILVQAKQGATVVASATTDAAGLYQITGLPAGAYTIFIPASEFAAGKSLNGKLSLLGNAGDNGKDDDWDENGIDNAAPATNGISSPTITLTAGAEPTASETGQDNAWDNGSAGRPADNNMDLTVDFGFSACAQTNLAVNGGLEVGTWVGTSTFVDANNSNSHLTAGNYTDIIGWYQNPMGVWVQNASKAPEGSRFAYVPSLSCLTQDFANVSTTPTAGQLQSGQWYTATFNYAAFDPATPAGGSAQIKPYIEMFHTDATVSNKFHIQSFFNFEDPVSGTTFSGTLPTSAWTSLAWKKGRITFYVPTAKAGFPYIDLNFSGAALSSGPGGMLYDNIVVTKGCSATGNLVGNLVFQDKNGNGRADAGEGVAGVDVVIKKSSQPSTDYWGYAEAKTDANGQWMVGLPPGTYYAWIRSEPFTSGNPLFNMISMTGNGTAENVDDGVDENGIDATPTVNGIISPNFTLAAGTMPTNASGETGLGNTMDDTADSNGNLTIDFGFMYANDYGDVTGTGFTPIPYAVIVPNLRLGALIDGEVAPTGSASADQDDTTGADDEDGYVSTTLQQGTAGTVTLSVFNNTGSNKFLYGWLDLNGNGALDAGEAATDNAKIVATNTSAQTVTLSFGVPSVSGNVKARFRISSLSTGVTALSTGDNGEIEDHLVTINVPQDFGDLADTSAGTAANDYQSLLSNNGPRHNISASLRMGATNTAETDAQQNATATGDTGDDGVTVLPALAVGLASPAFSVSVSNTGAAAKLSVWIDFNNDGSFNDTVLSGANGGEKVALDLPVATSATSVTVPSFIVPAAAYTGGAVGMRLRLSTTAALTSLGAAPDGEVEDYKVTIVVPLDFGDATGYAAATAGQNASTPKFGALVDYEAAQAADDNTIGADEDGVYVATQAILGKDLYVNYDANTAGPCFVNIWVDWNRDGDFADAGEQVLVNASHSTRNTGTLRIPVPLTASPGMTWLRARISTASGAGPTGATADGEVEDHPVTITDSITLRGVVFEDANNNGQRDVGERLMPGVQVGAIDVIINSQIRVSTFTDAVGAYQLSVPVGTWRIFVWDPTFDGFTYATPNVGSDLTDSDGITSTFWGPTQTADIVLANGAADVSNIDVGLVPAANSITYTASTLMNTGNWSSNLTFPKYYNATAALASVRTTVTLLESQDMYLENTAASTAFMQLSASGAQAQVNFPDEVRTSPFVGDTYPGLTLAANDGVYAFNPTAGLTYASMITRPVNRGSQGTPFLTLVDAYQGTAPGQTMTLPLTVTDTNNWSGGTTFDAKLTRYSQAAAAITYYYEYRDYGDHIFGTAATSSASQLISADIRIGTNATDAEGLDPSDSAADKDNTSGTNDEDLTMPNFAVGTPTNLVIPVTIPVLANLSGSTSRINVFVDWNGDGDVADANETQVAQTVAVAGTTNVTFSLIPPVGTTAGTKFLRMRITEGATEPLFSGNAPLKGEVEDYAITLSAVAVGGLVYEDKNFNGQYNSGTDAVINGATVTLYKDLTGNGITADDMVTPFTLSGLTNPVTPAGSVYAFANLPAGNYFVKVRPATTWYQGGSPITTNPVLASKVDNKNYGNLNALDTAAFFSPVLALTGGGQPASAVDGDDVNTDSTIDFGLFKGFTVGDLVFEDVNNNGTLDVGDIGISGVAVDLLDGTTSSVLASTTTDLNGNYSFVVKAPGTYKVRVTPPAGDPLVSSVVGTDNGTNNNNDGTQPGGVGTAVTSFTFTLANATEPGTAGLTNIETTIDFGLRPALTDFGDYPNFASASQYGSPDIRIGANATDTEAANPTTGLANADDTSGTDDEDLILPVAGISSVTKYTFPVTLSGSATSATIAAWADWNGDNLVTGTNEVLTVTPSTLVAGVNTVTVTFNPPSGTTVGTKYLRFRVAEGSTAPTFSGASTARGEVEDYAITASLPTFDYGDYTDFSDAWSTASATTKLGATVDMELVATKNGAATGDDLNYTDDEDGVTFGTFTPGASASINVTCTSTPAAYLNVWIDWNENGVLTDSGEQVATNVAVLANSSAVVKTINVNVPSTARGTIPVRVRLNTISGTTSTGLGLGVGEVEDHIVAIASNCQSQLAIYDAIILNNLSTPSDIEGRTVVKNITGTNSFTMALMLAAPATEIDVAVQTSVVAGGAINLQSGSFYAPSSAALNGRVVNYNGGGSLVTSPAFDFATVFNGVISESATYAAMATNSTIAIPSSPSPTVLTVGSGVTNGTPAVFSIDGQTLFHNNNVQTLDLNLNGKTPSAIIINVTGTTIAYDWSGGMIGTLAGTTWRSKILWNFPTATSITCSKNLYGCMMAPNATFTSTGGANEGAIAVKDYLGTVEVHLPLWTGGSSICTDAADYGDYLAFADASSTAVTNIKMGANAPDVDAAGLANSTALGDDTTGTDDEDGVTFGLLPQNGSGSVTVTVTNTSTAAAYLNGWIDWDNNGILIPGEQVVANVSVPPSTSNSSTTYTFTVPASATLGQHGARFRLTSTSNPGPTDYSGNGEVEDYLPTVSGPNIDYGDYTLFADASSIIGTTIKLGSIAPDGELAAVKDSAATGDDNDGADDEDGVALPGTMLQGTSYNITVNVNNTSGAPAYLNGWFDWNGNGSFDAGELMINNTSYANGTAGNQVISIAVPAGATLGTIGARFRLTASSAPGFTGTSGVGTAGVGEVEDYAVTIGSPIGVSGLVYEDRNFNGQYDSGTDTVINGATVTLYKDLTGNGITADDTVFAQSGLTNPVTLAGSVYSFTNLPAGSYFVKVKPASGTWYQSGSPIATNPLVAAKLDNKNYANLNALDTTAFYSPVLALTVGGQAAAGIDGDDANTDSTIDFGIWQRMSIGNLVFNDSNNDGSAVSEAGIGSVTVELFKSTDAIVGNGDDVSQGTTTTAASTGAYGFSGMLPGNYFLKVTPTGTYQLKSGVSASDNGIDNDNNATTQASQGQPIYTHMITLAAGTEPGSAGTTNTDNTIDIGLRACPAIIITPASLAAATQWSTYSQTITGSGGTGTITLTQSGSLPSGLTWSGGSGTATISGTPIVTGTFPITVTGTDPTLCTATINYSIVVNACGAITISPASSLTATLGSPHTTNFSATGGTAPYTWTMLPAPLSGLVSWYPGENSSMDFAGTNHGVRNNNVSFAAGKLGNAFGFDGASTNVSIADNVTLKPANITLEAWVNASAAQSANASVFMKTTSAAMTDGYGLGYVSATQFGFWVNSTAAASRVVTSSALSTGAWHHVVGTYDGTTLRLYVDGAQVGTGTAYSTAITHSAQPLVIGRAAGGNTWLGQIDEAAIYNRALTGAEVTTRYNSGNAISSVLPTGITWNAGTPAITGTPVAPATAGTYLFTILAKDSGNCLGRKDYSLALGCTSPAIAGTLGTPYRGVNFTTSNTLTASAGTGNYTWSVSGLPAGLTYSGGGTNNATLTITGTTNAATGNYPLTVTVTDGSGCQGTLNPTLVLKGLGLGSLVYDDRNFNGVYDVGTDVVITGATVTLYADTGSAGIDGADLLVSQAGVTATTITNGVGVYSFTGLAPGSYFVKIKPASGTWYVGGSPISTNPVLASKADNKNYANTNAVDNTAFFSPVLALTVGGQAASGIDGDDADTDSTIDFGLWQRMSLGNLVFNDADNNGSLNGVETGINGVTVELFKSTDTVVGNGDDVSQGTTTTSTISTVAGTYGFSGMLPGNYFLKITPTATYQLKSSGVGTDNGLNNDNNGVTQTAQGQPIYTHMITMTANSEPGVTVGGGNAENTIDIGLRPCDPITVAPAVLATAVYPSPYTQTFTASGSTATPYTFTVSAGALPTWATLDSATGILSGTPDSTATANFTIRATDSLLCYGERAYTITPVDCFVVTNTNNSGLGSLREAINCANARPGADTITFAIPGIGVKTITLLSSLPNITGPVSIDGYTQSGSSANSLATGNNALPLIEVNGATFVGFNFNAAATGSTLKGLIINNCSVGVVVAASNCTIQGNFIGTNATGIAATANGTGITVSGATGTLIGGTTPAARNVISGNTLHGVELVSSATGTLIQGNYIGTNATGTAAVQNAGRGIDMTSSANNNTVGGTAAGAGNVVSGNGWDGIRIQTTGNNIQGNIIGLNAAGTAAIGNGYSGIEIQNSSNTIGGAAVTARNVISGGTGAGVSITSGSSNSVQGNYLGLNAAGSGLLGNATFGITVTSASNTIGGVNPGEENSIAGNGTAFSTGGGIYIGGPAALNVAVRRNSIYDNLGLGLDIGNIAGLSPNDGSVNAGEANKSMDYPVITSVSLSGSNLSVAGYIGNLTAGTSAFAGATVEIFAADNSPADQDGEVHQGDLLNVSHGEGRLYLGTLPADGSSLFGGTLALTAPQLAAWTAYLGSAPTSASLVTATAIDATGNTSEFGPISLPVDFGDWAHATNPSGAATTTTKSLVNSNIRIGATVDSEHSVVPNVTATADGADEDGAAVPASITQGASATITVTVNNTSGSPAYLNAWIDFNNDGVFNDNVFNQSTAPTGERLELARLIASGTTTATPQVITFNVPTGASVGTQRGVRFRLTNVAATAPTGNVGSGEVEDYIVTINTAMTIGNLVWNDTNGNGLFDGTEIGIGGVQVDLYTSADGVAGNGDDVFVATTTTNSSGIYSFTNRAPGQYVVRVTPPSGFPLTSGTVVTADNQINNDNNGTQVGLQGTLIYSPVLTLAAGTESITDGDSDANTELTVDFALKACGTIVITPATLPSGNVNSTYLQSLTASGGNGSYFFSQISGTMAPGLSLNSSGVVTGTPTTAGTFTFTAQAVDTLGCIGTQAVAVTIRPLPVICCLAKDEFGRYYVGGSFYEVNGTARTNLARLNRDGSVDATFTPGAPNGPVYALSYRSGTLYVGGGFTNWGGSAQNLLVKLDATGTRDTNFAGNILSGNSGDAVYAISDNGFYVSGKFSGTRNGVAALDPSTSALVTGFNPAGPGAGSIVYDLLYDGTRIVTVGDFTTFNGASRRGITALSTTGTTDANWPLAAVANNTGRSLMQVPTLTDLIAAGDFSNFNGASGLKGTARFSNTTGTATAGYGVGGTIPLTVNKINKVKAP